jgi:hypothetical protein
MKERIARVSSGRVRAATLRRNVLNLLYGSSIGLRSGECASSEGWCVQ